MSRIDQALRQRGGESASDQTAAAVNSTRFEAFPADAGSRRQSEKVAPKPQWTSAVVQIHARPDDMLIVHEDAPRVCTDQFRTLAGALHERQRQANIKTVMITSANAHEGKTFTAANLGLMLGESYRRRVLIIDADLRRPSLHGVLGVPNLDGLADGLKQVDRPVRVTELSPWLAVLPGGTPDPEIGRASCRERV